MDSQKCQSVCFDNIRSGTKDLPARKLRISLKGTRISNALPIALAVPLRAKRPFSSGVRNRAEHRVQRLTGHEGLSIWQSRKSESRCSLWSQAMRGDANNLGSNVCGEQTYLLSDEHHHAGRHQTHTNASEQDLPGNPAAPVLELRWATRADGGQYPLQSCLRTDHTGHITDK